MYKWFLDWLREAVLIIYIYNYGRASYSGTPETVGPRSQGRPREVRGGRKGLSGKGLSGKGFSGKGGFI